MQETVAPRTTTAYPIKKRERSFESQSQLLTGAVSLLLINEGHIKTRSALFLSKKYILVDDVALARTTPPSTAEMLRRLQKLEEVRRRQIDSKIYQFENGRWLG